MVKEIIVANRIRTPDGTILQSFHRHDYKTHTDKNGLTYMVDGGLEYLRRTVHREQPYEELSVYTNDPHEIIRESFCWGTYGIDGNSPLKRVTLSKLTTPHIEAILKIQKLADWLREVFTNELAYRTQHGVHINES